MLKKKSLYLSFIIVITFYACSTKDTTPKENTYLVSSKVIKSYTLEEYKVFLKNNFGNVGGFDISLFAQTGIKQIAITYKTKTPLNEEIIASGAILTPLDGTQEYSLGSLQHGTIFSDEDAPSYFNPNSEATLGGVLASTGMFIALPDYIGYGASNKTPHPYESFTGLSDPNIDFIRAVKEYLENEKLKWNNKLLLAGYSEGGYATLAMLKKIEESYASEFNVVVASCGAGAYNKSASLLKMLNEDSSGNPTHNSSFIWVLRTYNELEGLNRDMKTYFKEPYATQIQQNGQNVSISGSFRTLLQPAFVSGVLNGSDASFLKAFKNNDIFDWKPKTKITLYHGTSDTYVPFLNSKTAYDAMKKNGALDVTLREIPNKDHSDAISDYLLGTFQLFSSYK